MNKNTILQKCWIWNDSVTNFVKDKIEGYSLNVCAGKNPICNVNLDLDPQDKSILKGDMRLLPFKSNTFDTVVSDPPWKIGYYERFKPFFECVRVCKVGGRIIYNATWIPSTPSKDVELKEVWVRQDNDFSNTSIISMFEKVKDTIEYNEVQEARLK
jgi:ubiquinone/menaquinone biosynthesis C-methylase UbiE